MTKANKAIFWSLVVCVMALVVGLCFVGTTFARYTSSGSGEGTATVSKWSFTGEAAEGTGLGTVTASPSQEEYGQTSYVAASARELKSDLMLSATLTNNSDVAAEVTVEWDETVGMTYNLNDSPYTDSRFTTDSWSTSAAVGDEGVTTTYSTTDLDPHFKVDLYTSDSDSATSANDVTEATEAVTINPGDVLYIYCDVDWISDTSTCYGDDADLLDTWVGENVASFSFTYTYTAVQAGEANNTTSSSNP